jgi:N-methylhydantoinase A
LASQDLIFGLSARMDHTGKELKPVVPEDLEFILSKFKMMGVKRVCVNLLFAQANPAHQIQVADFFKAQGFEVFAAHREKNSNDEMPAWRKNLLNACLSGVFQEHFEEIAKAVETAGGHRDCIYFINSHGEPFQKDPDQMASSLFGWSHSVATALGGDDTAILYLGLESFYLIEKGDPQSLWKSQWGPIEAKTESHFRLTIQPTLEVMNNSIDGISFGDTNLGYEPGPVCFGRGLRPMVVDLVCLKEILDLPQVQEKSIPKLRNQLSTVFRNNPEMSRISPLQLEKDLIDVLNARVCIEVAMKTNRKKIIVSGYFAKRAFLQLKALIPDFQWERDDFHEWRAVTSLKKIGEQI